MVGGLSSFCSPAALWCYELLATVMGMTNTNSNSIHLQGLGQYPAMPAGDLLPGDLLSWNYSPNAYEVVSVTPVSAKFVAVVERNRKTGETYTRRMMVTRLVAATRPDADAIARQYVNDIDARFPDC